MKRQIVAILIALVAITSLLTVSVHSEEAYKPIIQSVTVSPTEIVNGGKVTLTVIAKSNAPVNWLSRSLDGPNGNIYGGGSGVTFTNIGDDLWKYERPHTISEWDPSGTYTYSRISVENEGQLTSDEWGPVSFNVTNDHEAYKPIIQSVTVSPTEIVNGGEVTLTVIAKSNAPVNILCYRLDGPNGGILGGGSGVTFTNIGDDLWKHEWPYTVSEWDPSGTYTWSHISVENEGQLTSDEWEPISFNVTRTTPPKITSYAPELPVNDCVGVKRTFSITINQTVNVSWQINGTEVQTDTSVTAASYTNTSAVNGSWNVSAIVTNANGTNMQTWTWTVTSPCFIATAAYGTPLHEDIDVLRDFRDEYLMPNPAGRTFVKIYYSSSPPLADLIRGNAGLRTAVREGLVKPLVAITRRVVE